MSRYKKWTFTIQYVKPTAQLVFKNRFPKVGRTCRRLMVIFFGKSTTPNVARTISCKAWNSPAEYPSWVARCDIQGSDGTMLHPIFWKKVHGQKYPERRGIVEHQRHNTQVLFKTNAKSHNHPGIKLLFIIREQDTIGKPKKTWLMLHTPPQDTLQKFICIQCLRVILHNDDNGRQ